MLGDFLPPKIGVGQIKDLLVARMDVRLRPRCARPLAEYVAANDEDHRIDEQPQDRAGDDAADPWVLRYVSLRQRPINDTAIHSIVSISDYGFPQDC